MKQLLRQLIRFCLPLAGILFFITIGYNLLFDPFGVIRGDMTDQFTTPNERYLKVKHLIDNPTKYNSYFFGSSRVGYIDTRKISDSNRWYNLSYSAGVPGDFLYDLKTMQKKEVCIENLVIGIDDISYLVDPNTHWTQDLRKPYRSKFSPFISYLTLKPSLEFIKTRSVFKNLRFKWFYDIYDAGVTNFIGRDDWIEQHAEAHVNDPKFLIPKWDEDVYQSRIEATIEEIEDIILICRKENIHLKFFVNPIHVQTYLRQDFNEYKEFLLKLSQLTEFYDFSGINAITINNYNYYETSHFRPFIGDMMLNRLFCEGNDDFGMLVTSNIIDSVLTRKRNEIKQYRLKSKTF